MVKLKKLQTWFIIVFIGIIIYLILNLVGGDVYAAKNPDLPKASRRNFDMVSFYWTVGIVGGCIAATLSYVSWKKFKAEEKKQSKKDSNS